MKRFNLPLLVLILALLVFVGATTGRALGLEPFRTWFFCFAWWPYILAVESLLVLAGAGSDLYERPREFALLLPLSVTLWLFFEVLNFRLGNWHYINLPAEPLERWAGYVLSFATVLPGLFATARLLDHLGLFRSVATPPWRTVRQLHPVFFVTGAFFLVLPMVAPQYFFPLVWGALVLLLEPWLHDSGGRSLLAGWARGEPRLTLLLLVAGLICGGLWEFWNFEAGAKWMYTVPFVGEMKVFEMPVLGFLGFPFFALECYVAANAFLLVRERLSLWPDSRRRLAWTLLILGVTVFDALAMAGMDRFTVFSLRP